MLRKEPNKKTDVEICRDKIKSLLNEYNCELCSSVGWGWVYIEDSDTRETAGFKD